MSPACSQAVLAGVLWQGEEISQEKHTVHRNPRKQQRTGSWPGMIKRLKKVEEGELPKTVGS